MKTTDNPKVYVGTYGKYNNGSIQGAWIDLVECKTYEGFLNKCKQVHKDERDPEYMIQDCECMPDGLTVMEWIGEEEFNDIIDEWKDEKPKYEIIDYSEKAFAVVGDTKEIKDRLKELGGSFNSRLSCGAGWIFPKKKMTDVQALIACDEIKETIGKDETKSLMAEYMKEISKAWQDSMLEYFRKKVSSLHRLSNGGILMFEKPSIKTSFCFGYSDSAYDTEDYDNANKMAHHAATNEEYFLNVNLRDFDIKIKDIEETDEYTHICISRESYYSQEAPLNLWNYRILHHGQYHDAIERNHYTDLQEVSAEDKGVILNALKAERAKFEKRLKTYLKKYGLSKVNTWTYWRDA